MLVKLRVKLKGAADKTFGEGEPPAEPPRSGVVVDIEHVRGGDVVYHVRDEEGKSSQHPGTALDNSWRAKIAEHLQQQPEEDPFQDSLQG